MPTVAKSALPLIERRAKAFFTEDAFVQSRVAFFANKFGCVRDFDNDFASQFRRDVFGVRLAFRTSDGLDEDYFIFGLVRFDPDSELFAGFTAFLENFGTDRTELFQAFQESFADTA